MITYKRFVYTMFMMNIWCVFFLIPRIVYAVDPVPYGRPGTWSLIFSDEFNETSLNTSLWHTCLWRYATTCRVVSGGHLQLWTPNNLYMYNGRLRLRAQEESIVGEDGITYNYTSGMVMSGGSPPNGIPPGFHFKYGYVEAKIRIPKGKGLHSSFWLMPTDCSLSPCTPTDFRPEIDIVEIIGQEPTTAYMTYHYRNIAGKLESAGTHWVGPDFSTGLHTFAVDWRPGSIVWYIDGIERYRQSDDAIISAAEMYILLTLSVGGTWPGAPDDTTVFPSDMIIDYVRVWKRVSASPTVISTATITPTPSLANTTSTTTSSPTHTPDPTSIHTSTSTPTPEYKPGDANGDGRVDGLDYIIWVSHYNQFVSGPSNGDLNNDHKVDGLDYVLWVGNYGK